MLLLSDTGVVGGINAGVIALPPGELFSSPTTTWCPSSLPTAQPTSCYGSDAEVREEDYMAEGSYTNPLTVLKV
jgi:hypothetical protein